MYESFKRDLYDKDINPHAFEKYDIHLDDFGYTITILFADEEDRQQNV